MKEEAGLDRRRLSYLIAFPAVAIVCSIDGLARQILRERSVFLPVILPVLLAALHGGRGPLRADCLVAA